jgi:hypothetical protein
MRQKQLILLAATAAAVAAIAAISLSRHDAGAAPESTSTQDAQKRLFPGLLDHVNEVQTVKIKQKDGETTLQKYGDHWGEAEKGGFAIDMEPVRKMLIAVGEMTKLDSMTSNPANYDQLGLQDPDAEGSKSVLITLQDASGKDLAQLVLGKERESKTAVSNQRYVRVPGNAQTWLVQGSFDVKEKSADWLEKKIVEVKRDRIRSVEITQPDGSLLAVDRPDAKTNDFTLVDVPEGKELTYPTAAGSLASGLEYVNLEDVQPVEKVDFTANPGPTAKFKTFDGLVMTVTTKEVDNKTWAKFTASYEAPPEKPAAATTDASTPLDPNNPAAKLSSPDEAQKTDEAKKLEDAKKMEATAVAVKPAAEVQKEVADLNERLSKWAYQVSTYTAANLTKKKGDLLKDKAPPAAPVDPNAPQKPLTLPDSIPPEIQEQIKAHQASVGNQVETSTPKTGTETPAPNGQAPTTKPDGNPAPTPNGTPTPKPEDKPAPKPDDKPAPEPPHDEKPVEPPHR